jgi:aspartate aminotransferase-like enzyme
MRIGHLGYVHEADIISCMDALWRQLALMGYGSSHSSSVEISNHVPSPSEEAR